MRLLFIGLMTMVVLLACRYSPDSRLESQASTSADINDAFLTGKREKARTGNQVAIPLNVWLPPKSSWLADHYRRNYRRVLSGEYPDAPVSAILQQREGALEALFSIVDDSSLDGARAEGYAHDLVFALVVIGDERYANALASQSISRRRRLAPQIMFGFGALHGKAPKTEAICRKVYKAE